MPPHSPAIERFWPKVNKNGPVPEHRPDLGPCWLWTAGTDQHGYGRFKGDDRKDGRAHRWAWVEEHGPIPDGLEPDHLCRVKGCVRTSHMELVTHGENISRARKARTKCRRGHDLADALIRQRDGARLCRQCKVEDQAAYRARRRA